MHGYGLCLWWVARYDETGCVFEGMPWCGPSDDQRLRFLVDHAGGEGIGG
jgi:hypothetical protein